MLWGEQAQVAAQVAPQTWGLFGQVVGWGVEGSSRPVGWEVPTAGQWLAPQQGQSGAGGRGAGRVRSGCVVARVGTLQGGESQGAL